MMTRRQALAVRIFIGHYVGLFVVGLYVTVGTSGGFGAGASFATFVGAIMSLPWFAVVLAIIWFRATTLDRYIIPFCILGPIIVCGSWWVINGTGLLDAIALSCITSSACVFLLTLFERRKMLVHQTSAIGTEDVVTTWRGLQVLACSTCDLFVIQGCSTQVQVNWLAYPPYPSCRISSSRRDIPAF